MTTSGWSVSKASRNLIGILVAWLLAILLPAYAATHPTDSSGVDFSNSSPRIELKSALSPYHGAAGLEEGGSRWHLMTVANQSPRPVSRILVAEEATDAALRVFPRRARPAIRQIASSDPDVIAEPAQAYGRHAFRVVIPAARTVSLALRLSDADEPPLVAAWAEGALSAHNRQLAVFFAAVAGLIAAALAITIGLAVMTGHAAPRWGAYTLLGVFLSRLATSGLFDSVGATIIGGPYGLSAMLAGLSLAAGIGLTDTIAPLSNIWDSGRRVVTGVMTAISVVSLLAFVGVPGAMLAIEIAIVIAAAVLVAYLVRCGRLGNQAARVAAPSAAVFALVVAAGAAIAMGDLSDSPVAPGVIGGFASAGAVLLALAVAAGEGIAILPARRIALVAQTNPMVVSPPEPSSANDTSDAIRASHQGVFDFDIENGRIRLSPGAAELLGLNAAETCVPVEDWMACIHPDDREVYSSAMDDYRAHPDLAFRIEFRLANANGRSPWFELRATMMGKGARAKRCLGLVADVTTRKETENRTASRDGLDRLPDKVAWARELDGLGARLKTSAVALVDIDRFKSIHASLGDEGGDAVLLDVFQRLSEAFCEARIYRVGGDSFAFLFDDAGERIDSFASTFSRALAHPLQLNGREIYVSASAGVALGREADDPVSLMDHAIVAVGEAKRQGGGCSRLFALDRARPAIVDSVVLEAELRQALKNEELEVVFQPIMRLADGAVAGFEALLRWKHPVKGLVGPAGFIDHSEQTGSIVELGRFALRQAASELARWQRHFPLVPPLTMSVNLSRRQLLDEGFEALLATLLSNGAVAPGTLKLELTESVVTKIDDAPGRLARLKATGAGLSIDDFGTGLSALSQLKSLPFDTLKIDKSFLAPSDDATNEGSGASILKTIVRLAHELNLSVVAEGVETARDALWLRDIGCEFAQGYYFSPALPRADVLAFIARHHGGASAEMASGVTGVGGKA